MDESALAPCEAKWKPGRGAEQPIFIQALLRSPGQKEVNEVNAPADEQDETHADFEAILYTVKGTCKKSRERRGCGGIEAPAGGGEQR